MPLRGEDFDSLPEPKLKHVVTLFRDPEQRLVSGFYHHRHDCPALRERLAPECELTAALDDQACAVLREKATTQSLEEYAACVGQCSIRMLNGSSCAGGDDSASLLSIVGLASRINQLGFVGITDQYAWSVCLWHTRFGGPCHASEFGNYRKGPHHDATGYREVSLLSLAARGMLAQDRIVYKWALRRFHAEVLKYGVTPAHCRRICPDAPEDAFATDEVGPMLAQVEVRHRHEEARRDEIVTLQGRRVEVKDDD